MSDFKKEKLCCLFIRKRTLIPNHLNKIEQTVDLFPSKDDDA